MADREELIPRLVELHAQGRFPFDKLVRFYKLEELGRAMAEARKA